MLPLCSLLAYFFSWVLPLHSFSATFYLLNTCLQPGPFWPGWNPQKTGSVSSSTDTSPEVSLAKFADMTPLQLSFTAGGFGRRHIWRKHSWEELLPDMENPCRA